MTLIHRSLVAAAAMLIAAPALIPIASAAEPSTAKPAATTKAKPASAKPAGPRGPRSAKSLDCSKQADGKKLHGAARTSFMRGCNKG